MAISNDIARDCMKRILLSRTRVLLRHGFYGLLLMQINYSLDECCPTACTDGEKITFGPSFMNQLNDSELDFVLMHEILHVVFKHVHRRDKYADPFLWNIAADIVVNSNILYSNNMNMSSIIVNGEETMHLTPLGDEGYNYTAEEVYQMLIEDIDKHKKKGGTGKGHDGKGNGLVDDHSKWKYDNVDSYDLEDLRNKWENAVKNAYEVASKSAGNLPLGIERIMETFRNSQIDWRTILNQFVQDELNDYSFSPPDRRFSDSPFLLPDFNERDAKVSKILFMVDTSASITNDNLTAAFTEISGAIYQYNNKLEGWLGFFDAAVYPPKPFADIKDLASIKPKGGGGTDFKIIFNWIKKNMKDDLPKNIIILTDGEVEEFPDEKDALGIPVLWLLNNREINVPWGKVARLDMNKYSK